MVLRVTSAVFIGSMVCPNPEIKEWLKNRFRCILGNTSQIIKHTIYHLVSLTYQYDPHCPLAENLLFCSNPALPKMNESQEGPCMGREVREGMDRNCDSSGPHCVFASWQRYCPSGQHLSTGCFAVSCLSPRPLKIRVPLCSSGWLHWEVMMLLSLPPKLWSYRYVSPCSTYSWWAADSCVFPLINATVVSSFTTEPSPVNLTWKSLRQVNNTTVNGSEKSHMWDKEQSWWRKGERLESKGLCLPSKSSCWKNPWSDGRRLSLWELTRPAGKGWMSLQRPQIFLASLHVRTEWWEILLWIGELVLHRCVLSFFNEYEIRYKLRCPYCYTEPYSYVCIVSWPLWTLHCINSA